MQNTLKKVTAATALTGALALAAVMVPTQQADASKVKCWGIAKAGQNDCANAAGTHSCAGHSTIDYDGGEWKTAKSAEACQEAGGQLKSFNGVNKNISG
jgi:uncharacterized membrane protein